MILALETSTRNCSVALIQDQEIKALVEADSDQYIHSEKLHLFIDQALQEANLKVQDLEAVAVNAGPGSYTGLRIGVTAAKGLCYALGIPLISAKGTELLVAGALNQFKFPERATLHPMIDARRMEVYTAEYKLEGAEWSPVTAQVVDEQSYLKEGPHYFFGDGALKCRDVLKGPQHNFIDFFQASATHFKTLVASKFELKDFEDVAYFEPFYLKEFQAIKPKSLF